MISIDAFNFLIEAKEMFKKDEKLYTWRDEDDNFIALRTGRARNNIEIFSIDNRVGTFYDQLDEEGLNVDNDND